MKKTKNSLTLIKQIESYFETAFVVSLLNAVKTDRKEDRRKREMKEQERRVQLIISLPI